MLINSLKAEVAAILHANGKTPKVLSSGKVVGAEKAANLFEAAYDEHARNMAKLYQNLGS
jgi:hypothetical protein